MVVSDETKDIPKNDHDRNEGEAIVDESKMDEKEAEVIPPAQNEKFQKATRRLTRTS